MSYGKLMNDFVAFALVTYPRATNLSSLQKLRSEIEEVEKEIIYGVTNKFLPEEYADCFMCLLHSAAKSNISPAEIMVAFDAKLKVNEGRKWIDNGNGTYSHIKQPNA